MKYFKDSGPIAWMAKNPVAANIAMVILLVGGLLSVSGIKQEIFPKFSLDMINISVVYPGANPEEIEESVVLAIEDAVRGIDGIKRISSTATEGMGIVSAQLQLSANPDNALSEIKSAIDAIQSFPTEIETPKVDLVVSTEEVITLLLYGNVDERTLRHYADMAKNTLLKNSDISIARLQGARPRELSIEVPESQLNANGLSLQEIANIIAFSSIEIPAGDLQTAGGDLALRTNNRLRNANEFDDLIVKTDPSGSKIRLGDIAHIAEGFDETVNRLTFNGYPAMGVKIFRSGDQKPIEIAELVKSEMEHIQTFLPASIHTTTWGDFSKIFDERIDLLKRNALIGLILVFLVLGLFLELRLALWVTAGISASFLGAFLLMPLFGLSINMISLFAFIVTLGIVVDDAIVVGENIFEERQHHKNTLHAAISGTQKIAAPVTFAVLTTMAAFAPMFFVPGIMGKFFYVIPAIVVIVLVISLFESLFILPTHLAHTPSAAPDEGIRGMLHQNQMRFSKWFMGSVRTYYPPIVKRAVKNRYITLGAFMGALILSLALIGSGRIKFSFMPNIDSDVITISASYPIGTPLEKTEKLGGYLVSNAKVALDKLGGQHQAKGILAQVGKSLMQQGPHMASGPSSSASVDVMIFLVESDKRSFSGKQLMDSWREELGEIPSLKSIQYRASLGPSAGSPIDIQVKHQNPTTGEQIAAELAANLETYRGVISISDGVSEGKNQLEFALNDEGRRLGFTAGQLGQEVRNAFFGAIASRQQKNREEVKVVVKLPKSERVSEFNIENYLVKSPMKSTVPLGSIADQSRGISYAQIKRQDAQRVVNVTADIVEGQANLREITASIQTEIFPKLKAKYPRAEFEFAGENREQGETLGSLALGFLIALMVIYALLAIPFKSYLQPVIVMSAIPFGIVCAVIGHVIMGYGLSLISIMGIVALSGIVVNDSLVLVHAANEKYRETGDVSSSVVHAGTRRFRPIVLTSITTFLGLAPMIFETSMQARFLIPMAISLGFGVLFSTFITLILVPALYAIVGDINQRTLGVRTHAAQTDQG